MTNVIYIDHIRPAPEGEIIEEGSIVRYREGVVAQIGVVKSIREQYVMVMTIKIGDRMLNTMPIAPHMVHNLELIKCTIKIKQ